MNSKVVKGFAAALVLSALGAVTLSAKKASTLDFSPSDVSLLGLLKLPLFPPRDPGTYR